MYVQVAREADDKFAIIVVKMVDARYLRGADDTFVILVLKLVYRPCMRSARNITLSLASLIPFS